MRAGLRAGTLLGVTAALLPFYLAAALFGKRARRAVAASWFRAACAVTRLKVRVLGTPSPIGPTLFVANHVSYLDIPLLGAIADGTFVAKSEVAGWPLLGFLARLSGTVFVRRKATEACRQTDQLARRLSRGDNLFLFPEGTSSDGRHVLPFKPTLFAAAQAETSSVMVQPVTIAYMTGPEVAWYGDMDLLPHLWKVLGHEGVAAEVRFHPPVRAVDFRSRKDLVRHCHAEVSAGLALSNARPRPRPARPVGPLAQFLCEL